MKSCELLCRYVVWGVRDPGGEELEAQDEGLGEQQQVLRLRDLARPELGLRLPPG